MRLLEPIREAGFPFHEDVVRVFIGGSELHGAKLVGRDDMDIYGIYVEPPGRILGLHPFEHFVWSTSGQHERNGPQDVDITLYGLRKWAGLACKGNPSIIHSIFAPADNLPSDTWFHAVTKFRSAYLAKSHHKAFMGFADAQMGRLLGTRGRGKKGQRPELEAEFGYDVKAGMHCIRLLHEAIELISTGEMTFPRPEKDLLISIRQGAWTLDKLSSEANLLFAELKARVVTSPLPEDVDRKCISQAITNGYLRHWKKWKI